MIATGDFTVDLDRVPRYKMDNFCREINAAMEEFYKDPKNEAEFQEWLKGYKAGKEGAA